MSRVFEDLAFHQYSVCERTHDHACVIGTHPHACGLSSDLVGP